MSSITADMCVRALKDHKLSTTAKVVAELLGTSSRAVATALRAPCEDGRVSRRFKKGIALYRFVRLKPKQGGAA